MNKQKTPRPPFSLKKKKKKQKATTVKKSNANEKKAEDYLSFIVLRKVRKIKIKRENRGCCI